jgi:predicted ATPase
MNNHILRANLNIRGLLQGVMEFTPGLNIISGENGTFKTQLLQTLRTYSEVESLIHGKPPQMQAISPKRNSQRLAFEQMMQVFKQNNRTLETLQSERINGQINNETFDNYASLAECFVLTFDHRCRDGGDRQNHMSQVTLDFNKVINSVFPHYSLVSTWNSQNGTPNIKMRKQNSIEFPIEALSLGEQEVLSLISNIDSAKDTVDVYLIDEPEVHLNWQLEERLFIFLDELCKQHNKQAIVVTHSRTIFKPRFLSKTQFLYWNEDGQVKWGKDLTIEQKKRLAGDAIEIIALGNYTKPTFFVEDSAHYDVLEILAKILGKDISIEKCGSSPNVKSLFEHHKSIGGWHNTYFLIDGDNQGNPFPNETKFIHLPVYCIENILLDPELIASTFNKSIEDVKSIILQSIKKQRTEILKKNKFFDFLFDQLEPAHITYERLKTLDASLIVEDIAIDLGFDLKDFTSEYLYKCHRIGKLESLVPSLISALKEESKNQTVNENLSIPDLTELG